MNKKRTRRGRCKANARMAKYTLLNDPQFIPLCKFDESLYWRWIWKNHKRINGKTFLGKCMQIVEKAYLLMKPRRFFQRHYPFETTLSLPDSPDDLLDMHVLIPSYCLPYAVHKALRLYIMSYQSLVHQWSTRISDKEIPDGCIAVLECYRGEIPIFHLNLTKQQVYFAQSLFYARRREALGQCFHYTSF